MFPNLLPRYPKHGTYVRCFADHERVTICLCFTKRQSRLTRCVNVNSQHVNCFFQTAWIIMIIISRFAQKSNICKLFTNIFFHILIYSANSLQYKPRRQLFINCRRGIFSATIAINQDRCALYEIYFELINDIFRVRHMSYEAFHVPCGNPAFQRTCPRRTAP